MTIASNFSDMAVPPSRCKGTLRSPGLGLKVQDDASIFATARVTGGRSRRRAADQHFIVATRCARLLNIVDFVAFYPGGTGAPEIEVVIFDRQQSLQQLDVDMAAVVVGHCDVVIPPVRTTRYERARQARRGAPGRSGYRP